VIGASITLLFVIRMGCSGLYLGFFAGFLMYLATSDILPEAHASHPTRLTVLSTIVGCRLHLAGRRPRQLTDRR